LNFEKEENQEEKAEKETTEAQEATEKVEDRSVGPRCMHAAYATNYAMSMSEQNTA